MKKFILLSLICFISSIAFAAPTKMTVIEKTQSSAIVKQFQDTIITTVEPNDPNPFNEFKGWYKEAKNRNLFLRNYAVLSTVNNNLQPEMRTLKILKVTPKGFIFGTQITSAKVVSFTQHPLVGLLYLWPTKNDVKEISIHGVIAPITAKKDIDLLIKLQDKTYKEKYTFFYFIPKSYRFSEFKLEKGIQTTVYRNYVGTQNHWKMFIQRPYVGPNTLK